MHWKKTWLLAAFAASLFAFIYLYERHLGSPSGNTLSPVALLLSDFRAGEVTSLEIGGETNALKVVRREDGWQQTAPMTYPAERSLVDAFLASLEVLRRNTLIPESDLLSQPDGLADFGLEPPVGRIVLRSGSRETVIHVGHLTPSGDELYLRLADSPDVSVVDASLLAAMPVNGRTWRNRSLLPGAAPTLGRLAVEEEGGRGFVLQRQSRSNRWDIVQPTPVKRADAGLATLVMSEMLRWQVEAFLPMPEGEEMEKWGLAEPELKLKLGEGTNVVHEVWFGRPTEGDPEIVYAWNRAYSNVVMVSAKPLRLLRLPFNQFRLRQLVEFEEEQTRWVRARAAEPFEAWRGTNGGWRLTQPVDRPADPALMHEYLEQLNGLKVVDNGFIKDVVADFSPFGLEPPLNEFALYGGPQPGQTNLLTKLLLGKPFDADKVYARRPEETSVVALALPDIRLLPAAGYQLRDRRLWTFDPAKVTALSLSMNGHTRDLERGADNRWRLSAGSQGFYNPDAIEEALLRLSEVRAHAWVNRGIDKLALYGIQDKSHRIRFSIQEKGQPTSAWIHFGRRNPFHRPYAAVELEGETLILEFPIELYEDVLMYLGVPTPPQPLPVPSPANPAQAESPKQEVAPVQKEPMENSAPAPKDIPPVVPVPDPGTPAPVDAAKSDQPEKEQPSEVPAPAPKEGTAP